METYQSDPDWFDKSGILEVAGPVFVTNTIRNFKSWTDRQNVCLLPSKLFYPVHHFDDAIKPMPIEKILAYAKHVDALAVHIWNSGSLAFV